MLALHPASGAVFDALEKTELGSGGENELTVALQTSAAAEWEGTGVYSMVVPGRSYDTGDKPS